MVLTGLYTVLGGMRAVAYTEAVQTAVLVLGSLLLTIFGLSALGGWSALRAALDPEMFNLWKPIVPAGVEGTWAPVKEAGPDGVVLQPELSVAGHALLRADHRPLVLVHGSVHRAARARRAKASARRGEGTIFAAFLKLLPVFIFIVPGMIAVALARSGTHAAAGAARRRRRAPRRRGSAGGVSVDGAGSHAGRPARHRRGRTARRAHELARRRLQRLVHAVHARLLPEAAPARRRRRGWCGSAAPPRRRWCSSRCCGFRSSRARADSTSICRASRRISRRRLPPCSSSACS